MRRFTRWNAMVCEPELFFEEDVRIGANALRGKWAINRIEIEGKSYIGKGAFSHAKKIRYIALGELCALGAGAFAHSRFWARKVEFESLNSIQGIHKKAFKGCRKEFFTFYKDAIYFGNQENPYTVLVRVDPKCTKIVPHENTKFIFHRAFAKCKTVQSVELPRELSEIGCCGFMKMQ